MIGHVLRLDRNSNTNIALLWTPEGRRKRRRPKTTRRRTVGRERGTRWDGGHGMRQGLLQPTDKIGGILWRTYVPRGTKKIDNR